MFARLAFALSLVVGTVGVAQACPFCNAQGQTLSGEFQSADMIVVATLKSSERDLEDFTRNRALLSIDKVVKPHPAFDTATTLMLNRYIPKASTGPEPQLLLFCYVNSDPLDVPMATVFSSLHIAQYRNAYVDAYRGDELKPDSLLPDYLEKSRKLVDKPMPERLAFYFNYLEIQDLFISTDAFTEWGYSDYKDVRVVAEKLDPAILLKWLKDPNTLGSRLGLYGMLLGHCGKKEQAEELKKLISDPSNLYSMGLDGLMAGYVLLDPVAGWKHVVSLLADDKKDFTTRYAALRTVRFFQEYRQDVIPEADRLAAFRLLVEQEDIADLAIDDLRKYRCWSETEFVLKFGNEESHKIGIVKRSILKFAIAAAQTGNKTAVAHVEAARKEDPERVKLAEDLIREELLPLEKPEAKKKP